MLSTDPLEERLERWIVWKNLQSHDAFPDVIKIHPKDAQEALERWDMEFSSECGRIYKLKVLGQKDKIDLNT